MLVFERFRGLLLGSVGSFILSSLSLKRRLAVDELASLMICWNDRLMKGLPAALPSSHGEVDALWVGVGEGGLMRLLSLLGGSGGRVSAPMVGTLAADSESSAELSQKCGADYS